MKHPITLSANNKEIYAELIQSKIADKVSREPHLLTIAKEILSKQKLVGPNPVIEHDLGHEIGSTEVVETEDGDSVFYAKAKKSSIYIRYVKHKKTQSTTYLTMCLQKDDEDNYELVDLNPGKFQPPFPGAEDESKTSKSFWQKHAVVMNGQTVQTKTITTDCPY